MPSITIEPTRNSLYDAMYNGEVIVRGSYTPIFDACRVLLDRGITGTLEVYGPVGRLRLTTDIEKSAAIDVSGSRFVPWRVRKRAHSRVQADLPPPTCQTPGKKRSRQRSS